jgi:hypothetical protein
MLAPSFPDWLPSAVADEARRLLNTEGADADLIIRLATDPRMKSVWRELSKLTFERPVLEEGELSYRPPLDDKLSDKDAALVMFFWYAYAEARYPRGLTTLSEHNADLEHCEHTAEQLRAAAAALRDLPWILARCERWQVKDISQQFAEIHAKQVEDAATFCEEAAEEIGNQIEGDPLVADRPGHHRKARGYIINLASLLNKPLYGTLATVASVALDMHISKEQVIEWSRGVKAQNNDA